MPMARQNSVTQHSHPVSAFATVRLFASSSASMIGSIARARYSLRDLQETELLASFQQFIAADGGDCMLLKSHASMRLAWRSPAAVEFERWPFVWCRALQR